MLKLKQFDQGYKIVRTCDVDREMVHEQVFWEAFKKEATCRT
jgi:hypothetical protein